MAPNALPTANHSCRGCPKHFPTAHALNRHYGHVPKCNRVRLDYLNARLQRPLPPPPPPPQHPQSRPSSPSTTSDHGDIDMGDANWSPGTARASRPRVVHHPTGGQPSSSKVYSTEWEQLRDQDAREGRDPWHPFASLEDWRFAECLATSGLSRRKMDDLLALSMVSLSCVLRLLDSKICQIDP